MKKGCLKRKLTRTLEGTVNLPLKLFYQNGRLEEIQKEPKTELKNLDVILLSGLDHDT